MRTLSADQPLAIAAVKAIHAGDVVALSALLAEHAELATARLGDDVETRGGSAMSRTLLHVATDWPGHHPNVVDVIGTLIAAGADVDARFVGPHTETPLHWAASSDDVDALDALLDAGADIEADGAVVGGRTAVSDAAAFGQWNAARRLVERGARTTFWEAATLGRYDDVQAELASTPPPNHQSVTEAFWGACHGNQPRIAELLLLHGADLDWVGWDDHTPLDAARRSDGTRLAQWLRDQGARTAAELRAAREPET